MEEKKSTSNGRGCPECAVHEFEPTWHDALLAALQQVRNAGEVAERSRAKGDSQACKNEPVSTEELREEVCAALRKAVQKLPGVELRQVTEATNAKE
jgi:limonene-1,2-epoxide hydrolase